MNSWINSVQEFKKCSLKGIQINDHNQSILVDFNMIDKQVKTLKTKNDLGMLYYNSNDKAFKHKGHMSIANSQAKLVTTA